MSNRTAAADSSAPGEGFPAEPVSARPLVTLLLISYNQEAYVRAALEGALAQTYEPLEILVSDNASTDRTWEIIRETVAGYDGPHSVRLHRNAENLGMMGNIDHAMTLVKGEFVVSNHGDDISLPHRVERLVAEWLASGRRAKAIHSARRRMDEEGRLHEVFDDARVLAEMTPLEVIRDHGTLVGASLGWDRELWEVFGPISPVGIFDDFPTAFRASLLGEIRYIPEVLLHYRQGGTSARPVTDMGRNYLYGFRIKNLRWHRTFWASYLRDMEIVRPPDYEECRRICEWKIAEADFRIGLAETPRWKLPLALPGAVALSLRRRDPGYAKEALRYLLGPAYIRRLDAKHARAQMQVAPRDGTGRIR
jgi:glycosyltransferase involved in cell wall biosynthesis